MDKKVTYSQLRTVLESLGYGREDAGDDRIVFRNPGRHLFIVLPRMPDEQTVRPIDMLRVRKALLNEGVIRRDDEFEPLFRIQQGDRLLWTDPTNGREVAVTAASGENDGIVVIKQNGALTACPVEQLKRENDNAKNGKLAGAERA